ncbi:pleckstrin homology domain-containing family G member 6 isoform X1 [Nycticebus coucang]|uniref:pleckstrin homology domain-containing family G member 6 isoform X1 n=2 Tax=Nycticebus coucang TaxID=9470 RepID=UPI00234C7EC1|nr:pleckstrin homology domain-containing family G member 6 isoform X1 [Nycticebus coucang]XP_053413779.1 pleckstrin homology domain-containing family G member 6 isoform X1 [Nycticebus coucang]XP_053413780.1 pleckstrin homology domain-containing family G member 6 isoform X1 [Nycticebus coucang]XP_053413781.1 pleckstrin homology domain-containing family G member 6 isoform X1 [Nycticebus coucang]XP_053413782.1 pleckstrin homology domain-containing family G member 6 isoform X1 [Nycticebus coucang]
MQALSLPDEGPLHGYVASLIETYGGGHRVSSQSTAGSLHPRGGGPVLDPSRQNLQHYVHFAKGSGQARGLPPIKLREPEHEKKHGVHSGAGPPYSPKLKDITKAHELEMRLHTFSMFGMPRLPPDDRRRWEIGEGGDSGLAIEKSWRELVPGHKEMSRELCHQQEAVWELLTTELIYVRKLKIMTDLLAAGLLNLQRVGLLIDVSAETLFGNVPSLIRVHQSFWKEVLGPTLEETRTSGQPLDPVSLQSGFLMFGQRFQPYVQYCLQVKQTMAYAREQQDTNPLFHAFMQWCEKHKSSGRQTLGDLLIKPYQRITKYPLLLQAVLKRSPGAQTQEALNAMIAAVESFLRHINGQVRQGEEHASLVAAAQRIGPYDVLEPLSEEVEKNLRPFSTLDLMSPMLGVGSEHTRQLLLEGPVRVKEGREGKLDVYLFLFSDVLLVTKPQRKADKAKVIRPPLMLEKLVFRPLRDSHNFLVIQLTEFQCVSSALIVHCPSSTDRARWLEKTQQAQATLQRLKAEEYVQQKRELLALYRDRDRESPSTRPSTPSLEGSQSSAEGRTSALSAIIPHLVVTEDTDEDAPSVPDDTSDSGYGTLIPGSPKRSHSPLSRLRQRALRRDPRLTFSTLDLRDVPLRPQPPDPQALQRRSAPELPDGIRRGDSLPRGDPPTWSEEEDGTSMGRNVVVETLHRARLRGQLPCSPVHTDSAGESPWESSGDEEEEGPLFLGPDRTASPHHLRAEDMLREIREELASQRIEGAPDPGDNRPRKLTRAQLRRMRGRHIIQLDTPLSTSEV